MEEEGSVYSVLRHLGQLRETWLRALDAVWIVDEVLVASPVLSYAKTLGVEDVYSAIARLPFIWGGNEEAEFVVCSGSRGDHSPNPTL